MEGRALVPSSTCRPQKLLNKLKPTRLVRNIIPYGKIFRQGSGLLWFVVYSPAYCRDAENMHQRRLRQYTPLVQARNAPGIPFDDTCCIMQYEHNLLAYMNDTTVGYTGREERRQPYKEGWVKVVPEKRERKVMWVFVVDAFHVPSIPDWDAMDYIFIVKHDASATATTTDAPLMQTDMIAHHTPKDGWCWHTSLPIPHCELCMHTCKDASTAFVTDKYGTTTCINECRNDVL